jgi:hypothetical protein
MMTRHRRKLPLVVLAFLFGCDYRIDLVEGFELVRFSGDGAFAIVDSTRILGNVVVGPSIERYGYSDSWIAGYVRGTQMDSDPAEEDGYFLLDVPGRSVKKGLTWEQLAQELRNRGVEPSKALSSPDRFHSWIPIGRY